ncbi:hypothetical protein Tco_1026092 [Tanacetum coccineum]
MAYSSFLFLFSVEPNSGVSTTVVVSSSPQGSSQHAAQLHSGSSLLWPVYVQRDASNDANWCQASHNCNNGSSPLWLVQRLPGAPSPTRARHAHVHKDHAWVAPCMSCTCHANPKLSSSLSRTRRVLFAPYVTTSYHVLGSANALNRSIGFDNPVQGLNPLGPPCQTDILWLIAVDGWMGRNADIKDGVSVKHMTWNMSYLTDYEGIDGGYVAFGGNPKGGKITRKDTIKTVPRKNNMYSVDLKNIVPKGGLTCDGIKSFLMLFEVTAAQVTARVKLVLLVKIEENILSSYYCLYTVNAAGV